MRISLVIGVFSLLAGCAAPDPMDRRPWPDMEEIAEMLDCPVYRTPTCIQRMNKPYSCFCADDDAMRMIFEPDKY